LKTKLHLRKNKYGDEYKKLKIIDK